MPYKVGAKGSYGCSGYPALKEGTNEVMGCHNTRAEAAAQIYAINRSEGNIGKSMHEIKEGDMVMAGHEDEIHVGRVIHIMRDGMLGFPGSEYSIVASAEDPAILMQLFEMEEGGLEETEYFMGHKASEVMVMPSLESNVGMDKSMHEDKEDEDDMNKEYEGCGCPTCKELNVNCKNCPVCKKEDMKDKPDSMDAYDNSIGKSYHSDDEEMDKWDNIQKACWVGYEQQGMKEKNGRMVPNCVYVGKSDDVEKAESVSVGDHVTFAVPKPPDKTESAHGLVERVERSGTVTLPGTNESVEASSDNPVAVIRVYAMDEKGKMTRTDRRVAKPVSSLRVSSAPIDGEKMNDMEDEMEKVSSARLEELAAEYNKNKEGDSRITVAALRQVYNRGIGAYRTNPSSVRGSVSSAEQWAMGRVNAFMAGLRGRFPRKPFDLDLFPKGHPRSTKKSIFEGFGQEVNGPETLTEVFKMEKRDYSTDARRTMAEAGEAMPDGSFPIKNKGDLMDAIRSVGRASNYNAAKQHIIRRARALDAMNMLPEDWKNSATKGMGQWSGSIFDLNPFVK